MKRPGLGVIGPKPHDPQEYTLAPMAVALDPVDWAVGSGTVPPPREDQDGSGSCTEQMFGYMFYIHTGVQLSRRDGYSVIHQPGGGALMNQPFDNFRNNGQLDRADGFPEPNPESESEMTKIIVTDVHRKKWQVNYWKLTDTSIEGVARAIKAYKCVGAAFWVQWPQWTDYENPKPNDPNQNIDGSHALCLYDYGIDSEPYILARPSWNTVGYPNFHKFRSNYFQPGKSFDFYVMEVGAYMPDTNGFVQVINVNGKIGVVEYIDTPENLAYQGKLHGFDVPIIRDAQGKPVLGADGHIQIIWNQMNIRPATIS